jgi:Ca-activated chloride channel homolog
VDVVVPVGRIADRPVSTLLDAIASVEPRGSTDLSGGYVMGLREAARAVAGAGAAPLSGATVLLLSDGQANAGIVDPEQLASLAAQAQRGATPTTTSTLGLGQHYDEVILAALARGGSGEHRYAPDTDAASAEFAGLVDDLLGKSVTGALLRVLPRPAALVGGAGAGAVGADRRAAGAVDRIVVHGSLPSWVDGQAVVVNLGDLYGGEERQVLVTLGVPALASVGTATVAELELAYTSLPDLEVHTVTLPVSVNVVPGDEARGRVPDARVAVARLLLDADEVKRAAAERLRHGEVVEARTTLQAGIGKVRGSRDVAGDDAALGARIDAAVADLEEVERSTRERSAEYASKLAMESWNQTSRGKQRRRSRFVDEGFVGPVGGGFGGGGLGRSVAGGRGVLLAKGDIVAVARGAGCDAVVNAANPGLIGDAGVAGAIFAAGGAALVQACAGHVAAHGRVAVGDAVATRGFGAGVPWVVHAVGPRYGIDLPSDELLAAAHRRAVEEADALGCRSIAIPAISTGVFGYPVDEAAPVALRAVEEALARCVVLAEVTFVLWDDATLAAYRAAAAGV